MEALAQEGRLDAAQVAAVAAQDAAEGREGLAANARANRDHAQKRLEALQRERHEANEAWDLAERDLMAQMRACSDALEQLELEPGDVRTISDSSGAVRSELRPPGSGTGAPSAY